LTNLEKPSPGAIVTRMKEEIPYPIRLNRYLYLTNISSRREADRLIEAGQVFVNGQKAVLGQKIQKDDIVELSQKAKRKVSHYLYYKANKPKGVESHNGEEGNDIVSQLSLRPDVAIVGRLDKASHGLVLLTNDGRIVDKMLNPKYDHEKEYRVRVDKDLTPSFKKKMENGVDIEGYITKPAKIKITGQKTFTIILTEGKKHQIRRMLAALGYTTLELKRVRIMNIKLGTLKAGEYSTLTEDERTRLLAHLSLT